MNDAAVKCRTQPLRIPLETRRIPSVVDVLLVVRRFLQFPGLTSPQVSYRSYRDSWRRVYSFYP